MVMMIKNNGYYDQHLKVFLDIWCFLLSKRDETEYVYGNNINSISFKW